MHLREHTLVRPNSRASFHSLAPRLRQVCPLKVCHQSQGRRLAPQRDPLESRQYSPAPQMSQ